ncbi:four-carbon acid sugar kinase family protein [Bariatricus massiliensis]|uniref:Four-carbon acid sugar kinase family protein n=1 Tax=Bariatricus massiliensis TaxID=1745713 RepID=A0ABS8DLF6_9FIRM|nr:four-carbon acid sugar kinase family protein [Bariatricus massiliensis]MCB7303176.1 four-carbon acid sugar kinase family protein [Bariatricus massiliensis]MCB7376627.1 four-carbon acid sugar kinase family protein [Bariatricus massiliensis]MCB7389285.1 four-carbon acid sugar kinase family protein [Bariatricus massiliensis]MCB7413435.1 four-carbon acid sugar kinase family protein [Bariatricus massiliensis]MCQ5252050.1 four-carbon acid sugar kinase family protein [Bariatricus massiliensis]
MPQCIVIADDLTGANATGVLLKKMDYKTYTVMNTERIELSTLADCDCVMYPTDSRGVEKEIAYNRVYNVAALLKSPEVKVYAKRIDSTLRGNLGSETDAVLDCLGEDYVAICAPCFPASGRIVIGGYMLIKGLPLHKTEAALDPKTPVMSSEVKRIFEQQSKYKVADIKMADMMDGKHALAEKMKKCAGDGARILTFDCVTQEDLDFIADALVTSGLKFVAVDPGVFTATVARKLITPADKAVKKKILAVVGSVNPVTRAQMEELWLTQRSAKNTFVCTKELIESETHRETEIRRVVKEVLDNSARFDILSVTGDGIYPENRIDFGACAKEKGCTVEEMSRQINEAFAEITHRIFSESSQFQGLYTSGGDVTVAVCARFGTAGLCLLDEVLPLAAYGTFLKGDYEGISIITKGGMVGESDAVNRCVTYLKQKLFM